MVVLFRCHLLVFEGVLLEVFFVLASFEFEHCKQATTQMPWHFRYGLQMSIMRWWRSFRSMMATTAVHIKCQSVSTSILSISHSWKFQSKSLFFSNRSTKLTEKKTLLGKHWLAGVSKDCLNNTRTSWGSYIILEMFSTLTCAYVFLAWLEKSTQAPWKTNSQFPAQETKETFPDNPCMVYFPTLTIKIHQM